MSSNLKIEKPPRMEERWSKSEVEANLVVMELRLKKRVIENMQESATGEKK